MSVINYNYIFKFTVCVMNLLFVIQIWADDLDPDQLDPGIYLRVSGVFEIIDGILSIKN